MTDDAKAAGWNDMTDTSGSSAKFSSVLIKLPAGYKVVSVMDDKNNDLYDKEHSAIKEINENVNPSNVVVTVKIAPFELPFTGGNGLKVYLAAASGALTLSLALFLSLRKHH